MAQILELAAGGAPVNSPLLAFVLTSLIIEMTPGPNMAYLAVLGASRGRLAGFSAVLGVALGLALLGIAVGLGGGSLVLNNRVVYESLRWAGALYLCWLAFDSWKEARQPIEAVTDGKSHFLYFRRGLVTNLLNPKAALFFVVVLPEFVQGPPPSARELAVLVFVYVGIATLAHGVIVVLAGGLEAFFAAPQRREIAGNIFAALLLAIAAWLFVSGGR
jgi:threonine/homoserine/homoserine lactone efflux protein